MRTCSRPSPYIPPPRLPPQPSRGRGSEYRSLRHCEGPLPSTLGIALFASDETDEGKVLAEDGKALPSYCSLLYDSHPPLPLALLVVYTPPSPLPLAPVTDECGGCASLRYPPHDNVPDPS